MFLLGAFSVLAPAGAGSGDKSASEEILKIFARAITFSSVGCVCPLSMPHPRFFIIITYSVSEGNKRFLTFCQATLAFCFFFGLNRIKYTNPNQYATESEHENQSRCLVKKPGRLYSCRLRLQICIGCYTVQC